MSLPLDPLSPDEAFGAAEAVSASRLAGDGPGGRLPLTPEMLLEGPSGDLFGLTQDVGMGWSAAELDIEAENPLYLPQAKIWDGGCALGPALLVAEEPLPRQTRIALTILRAGAIAFQGSTTLARMRRTPEELVAYLYRETSFPVGCILLTGTGIVPPADFALQVGDEIEIHAPPIGVLRNRVS
jgi:2-dehydro-3-deoxy-D-arabinonate dehydratase